MVNNTDPFRLLVQRHIDNQLTEQEEQEFFALIEQEEYQLLLQQLIDEQFQQEQVAGPSIHPHRLQQMRNHILTSRQEKVKLFTLRRMAAAAAILVFLTGAVYLWRKLGKEPVVAGVNPTAPANIAPGRNGAVLTLANGSKVVLDSAANGVIAAQNGAQVVLQDGRLTYKLTDNPSENVAYNTMTTPNGRQFHVQLPDGTGVWLNAASSITYPTRFTGKNRQVAITGEVYFEVASLQLKSGKKIPFIVKVNKQTQVEVMGTHFNVNAYDDAGNIKTTLLEGKVKVVNGQWSKVNGQLKTVHEVVLKPGEQAVLAGAYSPFTVHHSPDIDQVMAWKNGLFNFNGNDIRSAINEIGRWYDLEVIYESMPDQREIVGEVQRNLTLEQTMSVLKKLHINYRIEGKKLIITK